MCHRFAHGLVAAHLQSHAQAQEGERQSKRLACARARPQASLDPATADSVMSLLHGICKSDRLSAVESLHQVPLARQFADRIVGLRGGQIVFDGPPQALSAQHAAALYGTGSAPAAATPARPAPINPPPQAATALLALAGVWQARPTALWPLCRSNPPGWAARVSTTRLRRLRRRRRAAQLIAGPADRTHRRAGPGPGPGQCRCAAQPAADTARAPAA